MAYVSTFGALAILTIYLYFASGDPLRLFVAAGFMGFGFLIPLAKPQIITDDTMIMKKVFGKVGQESLWNQIYNVRTFRDNAGFFVTVLSYPKDGNKRSGGIGWIFRRNPISGALAVSAQLNGYLMLLKEIRNKATSAQFDEMTDKVIRDGIKLSTARKVFWIIAILFFSGVLLYLIISYKR